MFSCVKKLKEGDDVIIVAHLGARDIVVVQPERLHYNLNPAP